MSRPVTKVILPILGLLLILICPALAQASEPAANGIIQGTVTDEKGVPVPEMIVIIYRANDSIAVNNMFTGEDGTYSFTGLAEGAYKVAFDPTWVNLFDNKRFIPEWYDNATSLASATPITVTGGSVTTANALIEEEKMLEGTVTGAGGEPLAGIWVGLYSADSYSLTASTFTTINGRYYFAGVPSGNYKVLYNLTSYNSNHGTYYISEWYNKGADYGSAGVLALNDGTTVQVNTQLAEISCIRGNVTGEEGLPLESILVELYSDNIYNPVKTIYTNNEGKYAFTSITPGTYKVKFVARNHNQWNNAHYREQWSSNAPDFQSAGPVTVNETGATVVNAQLEKMGWLEGTVTGKDGQPLSGVAVELFASDEENNIKTFYTDNAGKYSCESFPPGTYKIKLAAKNHNFWENTHYGDKWYDNAPDFTSAAAVIINDSGGTVADAQLEETGWIEGTVTGSDGEPLAGIGAQLWSADGQEVIDYFATGEEGKYTFSSVKAGSYKVKFITGDHNIIYNHNYGDEWNNNAVDITAAEAVTVNETGATVVDAQLEEKGWIEGTVTGMDGKPLEGVNVNVYPASEQSGWPLSIVTDANGHYVFEGFEAGNYKVEFDPENHNLEYGHHFEGEFYDNATDEASATEVTVSDAVKTEVNAELVENGNLSGVVTGIGNLPLDGVDVKLYDDTTETVVASTTTDGDGQFLFGVVFAGDYKVYIDPAAYNQEEDYYYIPQWYNDKSTHVAATLVSVTAGENALAPIQLAETPLKTTLNVSPSEANGENGWYVTLPQISLTANRSTGVVISYQWDSMTGAWSNYSQAITPPEGSHTLYFRSTYKGLTETAQSTAFKVDTKKPTANSVKIENGAAATNKRLVKLTLSASDGTRDASGLYQVIISTKANFDGASWQAYTATKPFSLPAGDGNKTIYLKVRDKALNESAPQSRSIKLDTKAPTGSIKINNGAASTTGSSVNLYISASDATSGTYQMMISNRADFSNAQWVNFTTRKAWTLTAGKGQKTVYIKFKDKAGNISKVYADIITRR